MRWRNHSVSAAWRPDDRLRARLGERARRPEHEQHVDLDALLRLRVSERQRRK
jgi:hypothetical protein